MRGGGVSQLTLPDREEEVSLQGAQSKCLFPSFSTDPVCEAKAKQEGFAI